MQQKKAQGAFYTPRILADFVSDKLINLLTNPITYILDPAIGDGVLIDSLLTRLNYIENLVVYGFDIDSIVIEKAKSYLTQKYPTVAFKLYSTNFLSEYDSSQLPKFDLIIANPPYIKTKLLGIEQSNQLSKLFSIKGHVDIYQAFLMSFKTCLSDKGIIGAIVSNRFLTTKGAGRFRELLLKKYAVEHIYDFGDTKLFNASVLPAVLIMKNNISLDSIKFSSVYISKEKSDTANFAINPIQALSYSGSVKSHDAFYTVKHGTVEYDLKTKNVWRLSDSSFQSCLNTIEKHTWCLFKDVGKIRVGVKTTADNVFIKDNWLAELGYVPELLKPLITHHIGKRYRALDQIKRYILYPHFSEGNSTRAYGIDEYPLAKKYLELHREQLSNRTYVLKANRNWYEIWVPQKPMFWSLPKIIFRDISEKPCFWFSDSDAVVNGDCYWMLRDNNNLPEDILWLVLAVANSSFIELYYDLKFQNKLYANRRRFITQYVEQFPLPNPYSEKGKELIALAKQRFNTNNISLEKEIDNLVFNIFGIEDNN